MISFFSHMKSVERKETAPSGAHLPAKLQPINVEDFLASHDSLIKRLKLAYSDTESWESKIFPCVKATALMCAHLPYSANGIFSDTDDLFKASVSAATYAIEVMESSVQLEKNIMAQHLLQGRLKAVACLASLCSFLDVFEKAIISEKTTDSESSFFHISESNHTKHIAFDPLAMPFNSWVLEKLKTNPTIDLTLQWRSAPTLITQAQQNLKLFLARHILFPETLAWLSEAGPLPLSELMKCLTTDNDLENLPSSVIKARNLGVYRTCLLERERLGAQLGKVLEPQGWQETLIRILRTRILNDWEINAKDSPLRKGADGLFLFWPDVCPILIDDMKSFGLVDLPTDPDIWAGCLLSSGITLTSINKTPTCSIAVTSNANPREAIKLSDAVFFTGGRVLATKTIKRNFEVDLKPVASLALSKLTREALEVANRAFTDGLPSQTPQQPHLIWYLNKELKQASLEEALGLILNQLTENATLTLHHIIDEGLFINEDLVRQSKTSLSFEHIVLALLSEGVIYQTAKLEPLWVTHTDSNGTLTRGFLLRPDAIGALSENKKLSFNDAFLTINGKAPDPKFAFKEVLKEPTDQLSLDFEGKEDTNE
ncbi:MAG TPA: TraI domain-containing protein [Candidatus Aphodousia faecavium]|nr:TraI domain-containing protein [Candidatus Aphodousia faecavium]